MDKKIGLYFGSFNPIHIGHLAIANYTIEFSDLDKIWFVITPHNPLKNKASLLANEHRYYMVNLAVEDDARFFASNIEFHLPQPNYTINTLTYLEERYPDKTFVLIMGADNLRSLHKWKNYEVILERYEIIVYPRPNNPIITIPKARITVVDAPLMEISASFIRNAIAQKKDIRYFLPEKVYKHIEEMHFYES